MRAFGAALTALALLVAADGAAASNIALRASMAEARAAIGSFAAHRAAEEDTLKRKVDAVMRPLIEEERVVGAAVGVVTGKGRRVFGYGKTAADGGETPRGDTIFEIGSISKVFTALLLADMVERGSVGLDDPVETHLPRSVRVPSFQDRKITLVDLAMHFSGLPRIPDDLGPEDDPNPYADYTAAKLYAFLSRYELGRVPGEKYEYSNLGAGLLGHSLGLRTGLGYPDSILERISRRLGLGDTRAKLSDAQLPRMAQGHLSGEPTPAWTWDALAGAGVLRSSADDMLGFLCANLGLSETDLEGCSSEEHISRARNAISKYAISRSARRNLYGQRT